MGVNMQSVVVAAVKDCLELARQPVQIAVFVSQCYIQPSGK